VYTLLWFSLGWLVWGWLVVVITTLITLLEIAVWFYGSLALLGGFVFAGIGIRRMIARHLRHSDRGDANRSLPDITPPIVIADGPDCRFYRAEASAAAAVVTSHAKVFDAHGHRLVTVPGGLRVSSADADGAEELAELLRRWLGYMDAIRWSTADMELPLLLQASTEHLGYAD
jgi:hypothetical protein